MREQITSTGIFGGWLQRYTDEFWLVFRIIFAVVILFHALEKAMWVNPVTNMAAEYVFVGEL